MVFHQLWPNTQKALGPTISGGFIEVNNCLIWCSTALKPFGSTFVPPLESCALMRFVHKFMYWCILYVNSCPLSFVRICVQTWEQNFDKLKCLLYYSSLKVKWICKDTDMKSLQTIQKRNRQISIYIQQESMYSYRRLVVNNLL